MRDPNRLDNFYATLCKIHKESFPDLRFGQLMSNFFGWLASEKQTDLFFPEEDKMIEYFKGYCEKFGMKKMTKINLPVDYVMGHLRYGHLEGVIELDPEAEKEFKELLKRDLNEEALTDEEQNKLQDYKESILEECIIVVDDYEIDEWGEVDWRNFLYEN